MFVYKLSDDDIIDLLFYRVFDPLVHGDYPSEMRRYLGNELPSFSVEKAKMVKGSLDFIGLNHYTTFYVKDCLHSSCIEGNDRAISGFVQMSSDRDGVPIGEPVCD